MQILNDLPVAQLTVRVVCRRKTSRRTTYESNNVSDSVAGSYASDDRTRQTMPRLRTRLTAQAPIFDRQDSIFSAPDRLAIPNCRDRQEQNKVLPDSLANASKKFKPIRYLSFSAQSEPLPRLDLEQNPLFL